MRAQCSGISRHCMYSTKGYPKGSVFSAGKHAALGMIRRAAHEVWKRIIRIKVVMPGGIDPPMLHAVRNGGADNPVPF